MNTGKTKKKGEVYDLQLFYNQSPQARHQKDQRQGVERAAKKNHPLHDVGG
jgi:hypothetical protein